MYSVQAGLRNAPHVALQPKCERPGPSLLAGLMSGRPRDPLECTPFKLFPVLLYHVKDFMCSLYLCAKVFPVSPMALVQQHFFFVIAENGPEVKEPKEMGHNS
ncbi:hypothetical protein M514_26063 [Trichuris suis]|uniref:Uncharacterized protein n=1 Tax=Trichuris suis TaxID=68888 RepID=A0A085MX21_9BILA|nr:hypothetical protein M514_26063 [Trichuris suis]